MTHHRVPAHTVAHQIEPAVLDERGAAAYTGMSAGYLRRARQCGNGPAHLRLGRAIRYRVQDLDAWLTVHRHGGLHVPAAEER